MQMLLLKPVLTSLKKPTKTVLIGPINPKKLKLYEVNVNFSNSTTTLIETLIKLCDT